MNLKQLRTLPQRHAKMARKEYVDYCSKNNLPKPNLRQLSAIEWVCIRAGQGILGELHDYQ